MSSLPDSRVDFAEVKRRCSGQCRQVIEAVTGVKLPASNGPCPKCGEGDDRFFLHKDFDQSGGVGLRNGECGCPGPEFADIIGSVQWLCDVETVEAAQRIAEYLGIREPRRNGKPVTPKPALPSPPQPTTQERDAETGPSPEWKKPGVEAEAVVAAGGLAVQHRGEWCVEFAVTRNGEDGPISGYYFSRLDGKLFPGGKKSVNLTAVGSDACNGWLVAGRGPDGGYVRRSEAIRQCHTVWRVEGPPDLVSLLSRLPAGHAVITGISPSGDSNLPMELLTGKTVYAITDNDEGGRSQIEAFAAKAVEAADSVTVVDFAQGDDQLPEGFDVRDYFVGGCDFDDLMELARNHGKSVISGPPDVSASAEPNEIRMKLGFCRQRPFPVDELPEPVAGYVRAGSASIGCDPSFIALPLLTVLGSAIGSSRALQLKPDWIVPPILWTAVVGESGSSKTPGFRLAMRPLRDRQRKALKRHSEQMREHEVSQAKYQKGLDRWKRSQKDEEPPEKPETPSAERYIVSDTTVEALASLLSSNPRGLLVARDELSGWLGSFDKYTGAKGSDESNWLSMFSGDDITVDRKGDQKSKGNAPLYVERAFVSICGGIQPGILHRALGSRHRESGLAARLLLACPPRKAKRWSEASIHPDVKDAVSQLVDRLFELELVADEDGHSRPAVLGLTRDAKAVWRDFYNRHGEEHADLSGELSAAWSKLEEYAARLALVIHCCRWAANDPTLESPDSVDAVSMNSGIALVEWFKNEARRLYSQLSETDEDREDRELVEWIDRKGGSVTTREVQTGHRQYQTAGDAESVLNELAKAGLGEWHELPPGPKGGRPKRVFQRPAVSASAKPLETREIQGFADANGADAPETHFSNESGEL